MELTAPAPRRAETPLASDGRALCTVVAPRDGRWRELGHRFAVRVREYSHAQIEEVGPDDLTATAYADTHLVLFGSILTNAAILKLYSHGRCFTDAAYPGRGGAEIRTVVDPFGTGKNVLLIGGTDFDTVHEAAINLNRSFSSVTLEKDGVLSLHRVNFCVTQENCTWRPSPAEASNIRRRLADDPSGTWRLSADIALYYYQTDGEVWAGLLEDLLWEASDEVDAGVWQFASAWGLVQSGPHLPDDFRLHVDRLLLSIGRRLAAGPLEADDPLDRGASSRALGLIRIDDHLGRLYGRRPFEGQVASCVQAFARRDPGTRADGSRDWLVVDQWLSVLLRYERYDVLDEALLDGLVAEALATADNLKAPLGEPTDGSHARNALMKIGAYQDSGSPLWVRRWLGDTEQERRYPRGTPTVAWDWYTGAYASDALPRAPERIPRLTPLFIDEEARSARLLVLRDDLDKAHEYLAVQGSAGCDVPPGGIRRLTWDGEAWLTGGAWARGGSPAELGPAAEIAGFAFARMDIVVERALWRRHLLWLSREWFLLLDEWEAQVPKPCVLPAAWDAGGSRVERSASCWTLTRGAGTLHVVSEPGASPDLWELDAAENGSAVRGTLLTTRDGVVLERLGRAHYRVEDTQAAVGPVDAGGVSVDAVSCLLRPDALWLIGFRSLGVGGRDVLRSSRPVDLHVPLDRADGLAHAGSRTSLTWCGADGTQSVELERGSYTTRFEGSDWRAVREALAPERA